MDSDEADVKYLKLADFNALVSRFDSLESKFNNQCHSPDTPAQQTDQNADNKLETLADYKQELRSFCSLRGYSKVLGTNSFMKKIITLVCVPLLVIVWFVFLVQNLLEYGKSTPLTLVEVKAPDSSNFPSVAICLANMTSEGWKSIASLSEVFLHGSEFMCYFESTIRSCSEADFETISIYFIEFVTSLNCFIFNRLGKNLRISTQYGMWTGLVMQLNLPPDARVLYHAFDNKDYPTSSGFVSIEQPGRQVFIKMEKSRDVKLPVPYTQCQSDITPDMSPLVKHILESGKTYHQDLCFDTCIYNYFNEESIARNMTLFDFKNTINFNAVAQCSHLCPMECEKITYKLTTSTNVLRETFLQNMNKAYKIPAVPLENYLEVNFYFVDRTYVETTQVAKVTSTDFVSNSGGLLGLFLGLSFISVYHFLLFLYDKITDFITK